MPEPITTASKGPSTGFCFQDVPMRCARDHPPERQRIEIRPGTEPIRDDPIGAMPGWRRIPQAGVSDLPPCAVPVAASIQKRTQREFCGASAGV
jgi:hypothetical protein